MPPTTRGLVDADSTPSTKDEPSGFAFEIGSSLGVGVGGNVGAVELTIGANEGFRRGDSEGAGDGRYEGAALGKGVGSSVGYSRMATTETAKALTSSQPQLAWRSVDRDPSLTAPSRSSSSARWKLAASE